MKYQVYFGIAIRIIILFGVGMLWTFINPELRKFLGDIPCTIILTNQDTHIKYYACSNSAFDDAWIWGARHYWYFWMMFLLFILSVINTIFGIATVIRKHYPD
jgi:NADH:ubiquinone oxidoreductase subunit 3 (subunit A)